MFRRDKIVVNLQKMEQLCKRDNGGTASDKLKALDPATGEFGVTRGGGFMGFGRSDADSITGPLGKQIILFFAYVKQHAYQRTNASSWDKQVPTRTHIRAAIDGLKRMKRHTYSNDAAKRVRLSEIIREVESLFKVELAHIDYEYWAHRALEIARNTRLFKSSNKIYYQDLLSKDNRAKNQPSPNIFKIQGNEYSGIERYELASEKLGRLRGAMYSGEITSKQQTDYAATAGVGNCGELSKIAFEFLDMHKIHPIARFCLDQPGDHVFTALGSDMNDVRDFSSRVQNKSLLNSNLKTNFNDWPAEIYVCDPWANISCRASDYPLQFQQKMVKWSGDGKRVCYQGNWISPIMHNYHLSIATYDKRCTDAIL
jgi:hypothetical protein